MNTFENKEFDIAISFAGEDRDYARLLVDGLQQAGVKCFFDELFKTQLWGSDLAATFDQVFRKDARYAVVLVSEAYVASAWTNHERMSIQARTIEERGGYLLPLRIDDSELPGLSPSVGYVDTRETEIAEVIKLLLEKLAIPEDRQAVVKRCPSRVPRSPAELQRLLGTRPDHWEHFAFAAYLLAGLEENKSLFLDIEIGYTPSTRFLANDIEVTRYCHEQLASAEKFARLIEHLVDPTVQESAFGKPGEPGDAEQISHLARRISDTIGLMASWTLSIKGVNAPEEFDHSLELLSKTTDLSLRNLRNTVYTMVQELDGLPAQLEDRNTDEPITLNYVFELELPPQFFDDFFAELRQAVALYQANEHNQ